MTADSEKFSASLEQIENHQKQLEQELADKGIDGRETMEYLLEKVTNRSNMPVLFIILMMGCIGGAAGFIMGNYQMMDLKQFWVKPGICLGAAFVFLILAIFKYGFNKKKRQKKLDALKEIKLVMDKLDAAKHERVYVERQLNNKKEALKDTQSLLKPKKKKALICRIIVTS